ncbi:lipopolysaccharide biosynthesis protein [Enterococcus sp. AZ007]|uniref:lipopolysaccharide biosynthesis protein n=1 Tax=Enterococcus sp. AZ007 TaxID=2774839 RepID=UPI003F293F80
MYYTDVNEKPLSGKKVLFICPHFFNYEIMMKVEMESLGAEVYYYDERLSNSFLTKSLIRISKKTINRKIENYYRNILKEIESVSFDYLLICRAETITEEFLQSFSNKQLDCKKILYLWDSIEDNSNGYGKRAFFDEIITFDHKDSEKYSIFLRPLFFNNSYKKIPNRKSFSYDISFVGTAHNDRYSILEKLKKNLSVDKYFFYYYLQSPLMLSYYKFVKHSYPLFAPKKNFRFTPMGLDELIRVIDKSQAVVDIQKSNQSGLTMRSIEILGARRKLITTNEDIKYYDFYNENNIEILNREAPFISKEFLSSNFQSVDDSIIEKYSITYFILELLGVINRNTNYYQK